VLLLGQAVIRFCRAQVYVQQPSGESILE